MNDALKSVLTDKERADGAFALDYMPSGVKSVDTSRDSRLTAFLKVLLDKALRKIGVSTTGNIYQVGVNANEFKLYANGRRVVIIQPGLTQYKLGDIIRVVENSPTGIRFGRNELHFFIKDIIAHHFEGGGKYIKILTLE